LTHKELRARHNEAKARRDEARTRGEKRYTGKVCRKHPKLKGERYVRNGNCVKCLEEHRQTPEYRERNRKRQQSPEYREWDYKRRRTPEYRKRQRSPEYRKRYREWRRARTKTDDQYRFVKSLRSSINQALKRAGVKKNFRTHEVIGCSPTFYREWIESKWEPGWTWENRGKVWHIDHKRPCASFDLRNEDEQRACFNWLNCRPLSGRENLRKGAVWNGSLWRKGVPQYPVDKSTLANA
jgi:hypothetical protein